MQDMIMFEIVEEWDWQIIHMRSQENSSAFYAMRRILQQAGNKSIQTNTFI